MSDRVYKEVIKTFDPVSGNLISERTTYKETDVVFGSRSPVDMEAKVSDENFDKTFEEEELTVEDIPEPEEKTEAVQGLDLTPIDIHEVKTLEDFNLSWTLETFTHCVGGASIDIPSEMRTAERKYKTNLSIESFVRYLMLAFGPVLRLTGYWNQTNLGALLLEEINYYNARVPASKTVKFTEDRTISIAGLRSVYLKFSQRAFGHSYGRVPLSHPISLESILNKFNMYDYKSPKIMDGKKIPGARAIGEFFTGVTENEFKRHFRDKTIFFRN